MKILKQGQRVNFECARLRDEVLIDAHLGGTHVRFTLTQQQVLDLAEYLETQAIELFSHRDKPPEVTP